MNAKQIRNLKFIATVNSSYISNRKPSSADSLNFTLGQCRQMRSTTRTRLTPVQPQKTIMNQMKNQKIIESTKLPTTKTSTQTIQARIQNELRHRNTPPSSLVTKVKNNPQEVIYFETVLNSGETHRALNALRSIMLSPALSEHITAEHIETMLEVILSNTFDRLTSMKEVLNHTRTLLLPRTLRMYNLYLEAISDECDLKMAKDVMKDMVADGISPDLKVFKSFLKIFVRSESPKTAWAFYKNMISEGVTPDAEVFMMMVEGFTLANDEERLGLCLSEIRSYRIEVDSRIYADLLDFYASSGRIDEMENVYNEMSSLKIEPSNKIFLKLMKGYIKVDRAEDVERVFEIVKSREIDQDTTKVYTLMINRHVNLGNIDEAIKLVSEMREKNIEIDSQNYLLIIKGLCETDRPDEAEEVLLDYSRSESPSQKAYSYIMESYIRLSRANDALRLFWTLKGRNSGITSRNFNTILQLLAKNNNIDELELCWNDFKDRDSAPDEQSYNIMLDNYISSQNVNGALNILDAMMQKKHVPTMEKFISLIEVCIHERAYMDAARVLQGMRNTKILTEVQKATLRANAGDAGKNFDSVESKSKVDFSSATFTKLFTDNSKRFEDLIIYLLNNSKATVSNAGVDGSKVESVALAIDLYHALMRNGVTPKMEVFREILRVHQARGDLPSVVKIFVALQQITKLRDTQGDHLTKASGARLDSGVLEVLLETARFHAGPKTAMSLVKLMKTDKSLPKLTAQGYVSMLGIQARHGDADGIIASIVEMVKDGFPMTVSIWNGIHRYIVAGKFKPAEKKLFAFMEEYYPDMVVSNVEESEPLLEVIKKWVAER
ncbi:hypothetical protein HK098_006197 [Nowakowskiella sp. JEL0407]|nr:hypothetical protein HK098_006197 [Nowakowskiella sp. JEL0407]